ncbi:hypothetical protein AVEN_129743-1 [Araneus ventricosus]|uniref:Uncharacterized protein n=1 Tax=Araneus ventricosus TaxID=182803 RepID=A0A4Y2UNZ4_ARAVE|nr:hypothetical protein AVEN_129743-1 [Araneus ventricosus]
MFRFEATRGLFWEGPRNFELRSDDKDELLAHESDLACARPTYTEDLCWNRISSLGPSGHGGGVFSLGPRQGSGCEAPITSPSAIGALHTM